jgi:hypothetical protein
MAKGDTPAGWGNVKPGTPINKKGLNMPSLDGKTLPPMRKAPAKAPMHKKLKAHLKKTGLSGKYSK